MKHARKDYQRIQDPAGLIPEDEPVFLLRGQDILAPRVMKAWLEMYEQNNGDEKVANAVRDHIDSVIKWQFKNGNKMADFPSDNQ